jgi:hypothetical protein
MAAGAEPLGDAAPSVDAAVRRFGSLATAEVVAVTGLPEVRAQAELWRLAESWTLRAEPAATSWLWSVA